MLAHECGQTDETKPCLRTKPIARTKPVPKLSQKMVPALKRKLWKLVSAYIRRRETNDCFSCKKGGLEGSGWHAGHLFPAGSHNIIRFEPKNIHSQCFRCNINLRGNGAAYASAFIERYGIDEFNRLSALSRIQKKWLAYELQDLIDAIQKSDADYECLYAEKYGLNNEGGQA